MKTKAAPKVTKRAPRKKVVREELHNESDPVFVSGLYREAVTDSVVVPVATPSRKWRVFAVMGTTVIVAFLFFLIGHKTPSAPVGERDSALVLKAVSRLMVLPDEEPTVATVADPEKLAGQEFFKAAKAGDRVLIYPGARKAILYSPTDDRIVEVAPLSEREKPTASLNN